MTPLQGYAHMYHLPEADGESEVLLPTVFSYQQQSPLSEEETGGKLPSMRKMCEKVSQAMQRVLEARPTQTPKEPQP